MQIKLNWSDLKEFIKMQVTVCLNNTNTLTYFSSCSLTKETWLVCCKGVFYGLFPWWLFTLHQVDLCKPNIQHTSYYITLLTLTKKKLLELLERLDFLHPWQSFPWMHHHQHTTTSIIRATAPTWHVHLVLCFGTRWALTSGWFTHIRPPLSSNGLDARHMWSHACLRRLTTR